MWRAHPDIPLHRGRASEVSQPRSHVFSSCHMWRAHPDIPLHRGSASEVSQTCSHVFSSYRMWRAHPDIPLHIAGSLCDHYSRYFCSYIRNCNTSNVTNHFLQYRNNSDITLQSHKVQYRNNSDITLQSHKLFKKQIRMNHNIPAVQLFILPHTLILVYMYIHYVYKL